MNLMKSLLQFFARLFRRKSAWDSYDYGKPSAANDEFRKNNEV
jgi:hypothetical protein